VTGLDTSVLVRLLVGRVEHRERADHSVTEVPALHLLPVEPAQEQHGLLAQPLNARLGHADLAP
jgi:hypothetical protein